MRLQYSAGNLWSVSLGTIMVRGMGENITHQNIGRRPTGTVRGDRKAAEAIGRKLLDVIVYGKSSRIGDKLNVDDLAGTSEIGDWKMPDFKLACSYAAAQGWLVIDGDTLTLTVAGSAAA
jgi:hypothetical protein